MTARLRLDRGQAFPIYVMMVAGLLFLALAFFAVGKASALRNGAQGAADASALAAAQTAREQFEAPFIAALWTDSIDVFLQASPFYAACGAAQGFASDNDADLRSCIPEEGGHRDTITTEVEGRDTVDSSVIPGSDKTRATAEATAIVEFRCDWKSVDLNDDGVKDIYFFTCDGGRMAEIRPSSPPPWSSVSKILFDVHLVDK
ncbi:pilus assembly protein TadG-related protein [Streptomyces sp. NBC_00102]|uniref:pilus assembly protein TadG-related protein n=1 Tax=Streptomyces sp. NBC_00102 TaxID=2975652 RepID=UPI0022560383|nr:pilus assembly protein TadG-related protein [Streptomyces sp. NBC_00102]MCX5399404.1 pilus assembly protein TadG-related protein [Streptomyces sp. NBC_00102]